MIEWLTFIEILSLKSASIWGGLAVVGGGVYKVYRTLTKNRELESAERTATRTQIEALSRNMADIGTKVNEVAGEMKFNGGSTARDAIGRVEATCNLISQRLLAHCERDDAAMFECDASGRTIWVNRALCELMGAASSSELLGYNWKTRLVTADLERVSREWSMAIADDRDFDCSYRIQCEAASVSVRAVATRMTTPAGKTIGWSGQLKILH